VSELALTLLRFGFLTLLWIFVLTTVFVLRRDLRAPREAGPGAAKVVAPTTAKERRWRRTEAKVPRGQATKLVVVEGELAGTVIPLAQAPVTIGRAADATLVLEDDYVSSRHTRLFLSEGQWVVEDLDSTNGTWIDKTRLTAATVLPLGQQLRIGRTVLELRK
jgi:hypothetical protein